jgi:4-amino-4-deoxy-L-arabinose transferase-like glycosyltransferase
MGLAALAVVALALRLWGIRQGLPWAYNGDEAAHFVTRAVGHGWEPGYLANPPAYTHLLHLVDLAGPHGFLTGRVVAALLGVGGVLLVALAGARLAGVAGGLAAGAVVAVAFLPVMYSHLALNDVPAMSAVALVVWTAARVRDEGTTADHALAGAAVGLAAATKYTAGMALLAVLIATRHPKRLLATGAAGLVAFLVACPNALTDHTRFWNALTSQSGYSGRHKLGLTETNGYRFYLGAMTWGLGWVPALAAPAGAVLLWARDRRAALLLALPPLLYLLYMGHFERFFGRWLLPAIPFLAILAGAAVQRLPRRLVPLGVAALVAQGLVLSVMSDRVLSRPDTRNTTRAWMLAHVPRGTRIVLEPVVPKAWGAPWRVRHVAVRPEGYQATLRPGLLDEYRSGGFCWVVTGSTQSGRSEAEPERVPGARAYYAAISRHSRIVFRAAPWRRPVAFDYERSFTYRPPGYDRPGEEMTVRRLTRCRPLSSRP